jgi:chorismate mutase
MGEEKENNKYYLIKRKAVPEVLLKVIEAKRLLEAEKVLTIQEAAEKVGLSRSSFYKYKDDIFPFHENVKGRTVTFVLQMDDQPGILSEVLKIIADYSANILTIHQTIPINGVASLTLSVEIPPLLDISLMMTELEQKNGIQYVKILAME